MTGFCSLCGHLAHRPATQLVVGRYRNRRMAADYRCDRHAVLTEHIGTWVYFGASDTQFRVESLTPLTAGNVA